MPRKKAEQVDNDTKAGGGSGDINDVKATDFDTDKKKTARRNKSVVEQIILSGKRKDEPSTLRYVVVRCDLRTALNGFQEKRRFMQLMDEQAQVQGLYRKVAGMFANWRMLKKLTTVNQGTSVFKVDKSFFDQCWSALDYKRHSKGRPKLKEILQDDIDTFISTTGMNINDLPMPVPFKMREPTTRDMETVAINHIVINLEARVHAYLLWKVANIPASAYKKTKDIRNMAKRLGRQVFQGEKVVGEDSSESREQLQQIMDEVNGYLHPVLIQEGGKLLSESGRRDVAHLFLPFLFHVATEFKRVHRERHQLLEELGDQVTRHHRPRVLMPKWRQQGLLLPGRPFTLLPDWQLQPVFVEYAVTQLATMFGSRLASMTLFQEKVFDLCRIRQLTKPDWHMMKFKSNGVELQVFVGSLSVRHPPAFNSHALKDAGFQLKKPTGKENKNGVDIFNTSRGVYQILQSRYDNKKVEPSQEEKVRCILIDPGVVNVVTVRNVLLSEVMDAGNVIEQSQTWEVSEGKWKTDTGWGMSRVREKRRRSKSWTYQWALGALRHTCKRTVDVEEYTEYARTFLRYLRPLGRELLSRPRRVTRYLSEKNIERALDKLADRIVGTRSGEEEEKEKVVVFFGDGHFGHKRGHVAVPRKALIMKLAHRGLVFATSERGSSKYCPVPGCKNEMEDISWGRRFRRCTSYQTDTPCMFANQSIDRDCSATLALAFIAREALVSHSRPEQYCC